MIPIVKELACRFEFQSQLHYMLVNLGKFLNISKLLFAHINMDNYNAYSRMIILDT